MKAVVVRAVGVLSLVGAMYIGTANNLNTQTLDLNGLANLQNAKNYAFTESQNNSLKNIGTLDMWKTDTMLDMWKTDTMLDMWKTDTMLGTDSNLF